MKALIVIPSRYGSTRFPGKPLALISGKSLIQRVVERVRESRLASVVYVATDDERIAAHVISFGAKVVMTSTSIDTGTDRIAAALGQIEAVEKKTFDQVINVQGDEPLIAISSVEAIIQRLQNSTADVVTLACPLRSNEEYLSPDVVKVAVDSKGQALYFSRSAIPWGGMAEARRHIGVYGYQRAALLAFPALPPSRLERVEKLEQLRLLENGFKIHVLETSEPHLGVDRPEDVARIEHELAKTGTER